ncbi:MAG: NADH:ubiquinone reductase (Na(+)-transporting) subunit A [Chlamydia sp. 32-24]|nr:MAG: NADH:ubiquinone reductase (Na(+)-transporting) subunit A [Chlamydia sp. 32-24]
MLIKIKKGLDIPIKGKPEGEYKKLDLELENQKRESKKVALTLDTFDDVKFRLLTKVGDVVKIGEPLAESKDFPGVIFVAPASGTISEITRGLKRRLLNIIIDVQENEQYLEFPKISSHSPENLISLLKMSGCLTKIRKRPFTTLPDPNKLPRNIFVKAIESAPFTPPAEYQVLHHEKEFQAGLDALAKLTKNSVHLVYKQGSTFKPFIDAKNVVKHTVDGPHPAGNVSLHIQKIDPIGFVDDVIWTIQARDVVQIGYLILHGRYWIDKIISIAGPGIIENKIGYFKVREGVSIKNLVAGRIRNEDTRLISGNPLTGHEVSTSDFLGYFDTVFCAIPENYKREFMHFFRLGTKKFSFTRAYLTGHLNNEGKEYEFTTNQHGEERPFIASNIYDKVQPLDIPTVLLVKSVMAENFDVAEQYGLLEVDSEDFALPEFIDPSKIEMTEIIKLGLKKYRVEMSG